MGPNSNDVNVMRQLVKEGMDIARFNFSHGDHEEQKMRMDLLKSVREEVGKPVAILLDTKGPEIRTGLLKDGKKVDKDELKKQMKDHKKEYKKQRREKLKNKIPKKKKEQMIKKTKRNKGK